MNWYLTKVVYQIVFGGGYQSPQFDEQIRLISASDEDDALTKAIALGKNEEETFYNQKLQLVQWKFVNVSELYCLSELMDGAEVYSSLREVSDAGAYAALVHDKAALIQKKQSRKLLNLI